MKRVIFFILTISCTLAIFAFSSQGATTSAALSQGVTEKILELFTDFDTLSNDVQMQELAQFNEIIRSAAHFFVFLLLGTFTYGFLSTTKVKRPFIAALIFCVTYAIFDECYQEFFSEGRAFQLVDLVKDWSGSLIGAGSIAVIEKRKYKA